METKLLKCVFAILFLLPATCRAWSDEDRVHFAAHVGTAFAVDTVAYGVNKKIGLYHPKSLAFIETLAVGVLYKLGEKSRDNRGLATPLVEDAVGAGAATVTIVTFEF